jgi:hypothetical protein
MSNPVICHYECPRCRNHFWTHEQPPIIYIPGVTTFAHSCRKCGCKGIKPYRKEWPGDETYSLPDNGLGG